MQNENYDAIVIGTGIGGLTTAALLAKAEGKKVLLLERHFKTGGFTHTFQRKKYEWDVGIHYIGGMDEKQFARKLFDYITEGQLEWVQMKEPFQIFGISRIEF